MFRRWKTVLEQVYNKVQTVRSSSRGVESPQEILLSFQWTKLNSERCQDFKGFIRGLCMGSCSWMYFHLSQLYMEITVLSIQGGSERASGVRWTDWQTSIAEAPLRYCGASIAAWRRKGLTRQGCPLMSTGMSHYYSWNFSLTLRALDHSSECRIIMYHENITDARLNVEQSLPE